MKMLYLIEQNVGRRLKNIYRIFLYIEKQYFIMKKKFFNFCEKWIVGGLSIKLKKDLYLNMPKVAPYFIAGFTSTAFGEEYLNDYLYFTGILLLVVGIFGFFYFNIFKSRRPAAPSIEEIIAEKKNRII